MKTTENKQRNFEKRLTVLLILSLISTFSFFAFKCAHPLKVKRLEHFNLVFNVHFLSSVTVMYLKVAFSSKGFWVLFAKDLAECDFYVLHTLHNCLSRISPKAYLIFGACHFAGHF